MGFIFTVTLMCNTVFASGGEGNFISSDEEVFSSDENVENQNHMEKIISDGKEEFVSMPTDVRLQEQEFDLLLVEGVTVEQFEQASYCLSEDISISAIPEIGLIHIVLPHSIQKDVFLSDETIQSYVYIQGEMPDIQLPQEPVGTVDLDNVNLGNTGRSLYSEITDEELFDLMAWHVDEVTDSRASLEISKGAGSRIALIDSGIDVNHPILEGKINVANSLSYVEGESSIQDTNGHGTSVAGIIAQIAPAAEMTAYRVIGDKDGNSEWTIEALLQAVEDGNDIINMSLGTYKCKDIDSEMLTIASFDRAVQYAEYKDVVVVSSAGNKALNLDQYYETEHIKHLPGGLNGVVTISSSYEETLASYSNYGSNVDYCAPGGDTTYTDDGLVDISRWVYCLYPTNKDNGLASLGVPQGYSLSCGTSLAAPQVTAALADILAVAPTSSTDELVEYLHNGTKDLGESGYDIQFGNGKIDIESSLKIMCENVK